MGALFLQHASKGALPTLYAAMDERINGGEFLGPDGFQQTRGYPTIVDSDADAKNIEVAERLWKVSEEMTGVFYLS